MSNKFTHESLSNNCVTKKVIVMAYASLTRQWSLYEIFSHNLKKNRIIFLEEFKRLISFRFITYWVVGLIHVDGPRSVINCKFIAYFRAGERNFVLLCVTSGVFISFSGLVQKIVRVFWYCLMAVCLYILWGVLYCIYILLQRAVDKNWWI